MMEFKRINGVVEQRKKEQMEADYDRMKADIDYIAMMADVDLTENEENGGMENE
ncbi:MAG: hypothetical protein [Bacteriophage sp.]|nr:MAG: hypothetical protein [Bacteriophage sp.]